MDKLSKEFGMSFERGTDIGFDMAEIKQNSTEDLLVLRSSIYAYLNAKRLKKRNSKYMDVYIRINKELSLRKAENQDKKIQKNFDQEKSNDVNKHKTTSFSAQSLFEFFEKQKNDYDKEDLLKKKSKNTSTFNFPNFLNDKKNEEIEKKKEILKQSVSVVSVEKNSILTSEKIKENQTSTSMNKLFTGKYLINKLINYLINKLN
jgi:hypothetical protein